MSQVQTRSCTQSCEEHTLEEAESWNGWLILLLHCSSQSNLQAISDEVEGPPCKKACHTNESQYERVLQEHNLIITVIETTIVPAGKFKKGNKKGQKQPDKCTEKNLSAFEFSISLGTTFQ